MLKEDDYDFQRVVIMTLKLYNNNDSIGRESLSI